MADDPTGGPPRGQTRVPIDAEVQLEFENFSGFIREVSANLSLGGMFVKTRYLKPVGTIVRFEFRLSDQYRLIRGSGEVVWTRWRDQPPAMPAGMGIQFLDLDAESRSLVTAIVEQHERAGGSPFDLGSQAELEAASPAPSGGSSFASALPAAPGAGVSSAEVSRWLDTGSSVEVQDPEPAVWGEHAAEIFVPPALPDLPDRTPAPQALSWQDPNPSAPEAEPELEVGFARLPDLPSEIEEPPAPSPDDTVSWGLAPRESAGQSRPLDWGAAEAMAALGISTSAPVAAAPHEPVFAHEPAEIPPPRAVPPPPRFGGGQAARGDEGPRRVLWVVAAATVAIFAVGGWWIFRGRQSASRTPVAAAPAERPAPAPAAPAPSVTEPSTATPPPVSRPAGPEGPTGSLAAALSQPAASAPTAQPAPAAASPAPVTAAPAPAAAAPAPVAVAPPVATAPRFSSVLSITWQTHAGETEVAIATNGTVRAEDIESSRLEKPEPRELVKLKGVRQAFNPTKLEVKTPELKQIRVGFHAEGAEGQLHIVLDLASPDVRVLSAKPEGVVVRVRLGRS